MLSAIDSYDLGDDRRQLKEATAERERLEKTSAAQVGQDSYNNSRDHMNNSRDRIN